MSTSEDQHVSHSIYRSLFYPAYPFGGPNAQPSVQPDVTLIYREASGNDQTLPLLWRNDIYKNSTRLAALLRPASESNYNELNLRLTQVTRLTAVPLVQFLRGGVYGVRQTTLLVLHVQMYKLGEVYNIVGLRASALEQLVLYIQYTGATGIPVFGLPDAVRFVYCNLATDCSFVEIINALVQCVKQGFQRERFRQDWVMVQLMEDLPHFHHALCDASFEYYWACMAAESPQIDPQQKEQLETLTFASEFAARSSPDRCPRGLPYELVREAEEILERLPLVKGPAQTSAAQAVPPVKPAPRTSKFAQFFAEHYDANGRLIKPLYDCVRGADEEPKQVGPAKDSPQMQTKPQTCSACAEGQDEGVNLFDQCVKGNERPPSLLTGQPCPSQTGDHRMARLREALPPLNTSVLSTHELDARLACMLHASLPSRPKPNVETKSVQPQRRSQSPPHGSNADRMSRLTLDFHSYIPISVYDPPATPALVAPLQPDYRDGENSKQDRVADLRQRSPRLDTSVPRTDEYELDKAACKTPIWECGSADEHLLEGPGNTTYSPASPPGKAAPEEELSCLDGDGLGHRRIANLRQTLPSLDTSVPRTQAYVPDAAACKTPIWECETADEHSLEQPGYAILSPASPVEAAMEHSPTESLVAVGIAHVTQAEQSGLTISPVGSEEWEIMEAE
nr:hypothetical protein B0A51_01755 [Rachicladosporium sp. CCFEE 5018]